MDQSTTNREEGESTLEQQHRQLFGSDQSTPLADKDKLAGEFYTLRQPSLRRVVPSVTTYSADQQITAK